MGLYQLMERKIYESTEEERQQNYWAQEHSSLALLVRSELRDCDTITIADRNGDGKAREYYLVPVDGIKETEQDPCDDCEHVSGPLPETDDPCLGCAEPKTDTIERAGTQPNLEKGASDAN